MAHPARTICMVVHDHYPKDVRVWRAARAARDAGWEVTVVCLRHPHEAPREELDGVQVRRLGVEHRPGSSMRRILVEYLAFTVLATLSVLALHLRRRQAVVHINNPPDFLALAALAPKLLGSRVIFDIHDLSPLMFDVRFRGRPGSRAVIGALTVMQRVVSNLSDRVVTPHVPSARRIAESGVPLEHIEIMMNPPDGELLQRVLERPRERAPRAGGEFLLAYHGTVTHWYGIELMVEAVGLLRDELPGLRALIVGGGDAVDSVRQRIADLRLEDRIQFRGEFLPYEEALAAVREADAGVVPNLPSLLNDLTLSGKLLDYALLGVPAIVAELEGQAAHFSPEEVTFFTAGDAESLAGAIRWVAANPEEASAKAERARERAGAYSWERQRDTYQHLLDELTGSVLKPAPAAGVS